MSENNDFRHEEQGYNNPENLYHFNYHEQHNTPGDPGWAEAPAEEETEPEGAEEAEPLAAGVPQALRVSTASRAARVRKARMGVLLSRDRARARRISCRHDSTLSGGKKEQRENKR